MADECDKDGFDAHGVQVPMDVADGDLREHGVRVFMHKMEKLKVQVLGNRNKMEKLKVQVLGNRNSYNASEEIETAGSNNTLACEKCEKRGDVGATCIQHRSLPVEINGTPGIGAHYVVNYMDDGCNQCRELAIWNSSDSVVNESYFEPYMEVCVAAMNMQIMMMDYLVDYVMENFVMVYDVLVNLINNKVNQIGAMWLALTMVDMRQVWELMSMEAMWYSWLVTIAICYTMVSHLGLCRAAKRSTTSRSRRRQFGVQRHQQKVQLKALLFATWAYHCQAMEGGEQAFLQRMSTLAEAATSAASAAEKALNMMASATGGSSSSTGDATQSGLSVASRVLKNPDCFTGDDPYAFAAWKFGFCSWLSFGDARYQRGLEAIEKLKPNEEIKPYSPEQDLSTKLYSILTSYLRGCCVGLVRSLAKQKDGFRLWRALVTEYEPASRQRSLAVAQALASYPSFPTSKTAMENILNYEALVTQFEELSGQTYPEELKSATLIRCAESKLREHLQLTIGDGTTYGQLREAILGYEKASKSWTTEAVLKALNPIADNSNANSGPVPMEVDRIANEKGKGSKGKNSKGKSKGKSWWSFGSYGLYGRGRGRGKGRGNKGKGKGKQKGKSKGKSKSYGKNYGKKGGQKGKQNVDPQQCRLCHEFGHWSRECPNRMTNQVINSGVPSQQPQVPVQQPAQGGAQPRSSMASSYPPTSSTASSVRRIYGIPMSAVSSSTSSVRMIACGETNDGKNVVILDSGSDVSLLPMAAGFNADEPADRTKVQLRDCQGQELQVAGVKQASLVVEDADGSQAELETQFLVAGSIKSAILSLGQLYRAGWSVSQAEHGPVLESHDKTLRVPVFYVRNSLAIRAEVCRVEDSHDEFPEVPMVRAVVELEERFRPDNLRYNQWETNVDGNPYMRSTGENFIDPTFVWPASFRYRTTLIQKKSTSEEDHGWCVVEVSRKFLELKEPFGRIAEVERTIWKDCGS